MTSYTIHRPDSDDADETRWARTETFIMGAARCLLDTRTEVLDGEDHEDETRYADAVWWHSPRAGWELDALAPDDRATFREACEWFITGCWADLDTMAAELVARKSSRDLDWAWYRLGELFVFNTNGEGVGFWEYGDVGRRMSEAVARNGASITAYCYDQEVYPTAETYVHLN